ncbi:hypothetical protein P261_01777 [Lachnospiraceae bacterium TWA4]|nr:hypothetical protein P261_01777 [Lachnospiraceae bacterium TWA4]
MPFVIGLLIAWIAAPIVRFLERHLKIVRKAGSFLIIVVVLAGIVGLIYLIIYNLVLFSMDLIKDAPSIYHSIQADMQVTMDNLEKLANRLPADLSNRIQLILENLEASLSEILSSLLAKVTDPTISAAGSVVKRVPNGLVYTIITILAAYFFLADFDHLMSKFYEKLPKSVEETIHVMRDKVKEVIGGYFFAQFKIMIVVAIILTIGFLILGISYSVLLGLVISFVDFLPILGTGTVLIPWALIQLINGSYTMAIGLLIIYGVSQAVHQLVQPKLIGDSMGINPLLTLFLLYIGFRVSGFTGMILAVPIGLLFIELCKIGVYQSVVDGVNELVESIKKLRQGSD